MCASKKGIAKPGKNGYKILFNSNTMIMNYKFAMAAAKYGTEEYKLIKSICDDFPGMKEVIVSGHEQKQAAPNARLTYANMEKHISVYENADELMEAFRTVKAMSQKVASPYKYVRDWFVKQFPDYKTAPEFKDGKLTIVPEEPPKVIEYKQKMPKVG